MKLSARSLLMIDRFFWPIHRVMELLFRIFGKISTTRGDSVVIFKFMGLGSLVRLASLCKQHHVDKEKIKLVTFDHQKEVCDFLGFTNTYFIRTHHLIHFLRDCLQLGIVIRKQKPSIIIDFERCSHAVATFRIFSTWLGRCPSVSFEFNRSLASRKLTIHAVEELTLEQLFVIGLEYVPKSHLQHYTREVNVESNKILINVNASDLLPSRKYALTSHARVIEQLHKENKEFEFHLIGLAEEFDYVNQLTSLTKGLPVFNRAGDWSLRQLAIELSNCAVFITGDSGPMHLAIYLGIPTIALWGPTQAIHFGYSEEPHLTSLSLSLKCSPCFTHPASKPEESCRGKIDCLNDLPPALVVASVRKILSDSHKKRNVAFPQSWLADHNTKLQSSLAT